MAGNGDLRIENYPGAAANSSFSIHKVVAYHPLHVGLYDGFGKGGEGVAGGRGCLVVGQKVMLLQRVGGEVVEGGGDGAVEEEEVLVFDQLVDSIVVVDGPGAVGGGV